MKHLIPDWISVPAGSFVMGSPTDQLGQLAKRFGGTRESYAIEAPHHAVTLQPFQIARTPVTHQQYAAFVAATQTRSPVQWHGTQPPATLWSLPVVDVTWHEAQAYCVWLSNEIEQVVRLPTEAEWERAARGTDERMWPWGNELDPGRANTAEATHGGPTSVGAYLTGASPVGALDMAGNVWEWTASLQAPYPYIAADGRESPQAVEGMDRRRIMRGGCWANPAHFARTTCRFRLPPESSTHLLGFRVASNG